MRIQEGTVINDKKIKTILDTFPILQHQWELDAFGYIVMFEDDSVGLIQTNHGKPFIASEKDIDESITYYKNIIDISEKARELYLRLKNQTGVEKY